MGCADRADSGACHMSNRERVIDAPIENLRTLSGTRPELSGVNTPPTDLFSAASSELRLRLQVAPSDPLHGVWRDQAPPALRSQLRGLRRELLMALDATIKRGVAPTLLVTSALPGD